MRGKKIFKTVFVLLAVSAALFIFGCAQSENKPELTLTAGESSVTVGGKISFTLTCKNVEGAPEIVYQIRESGSGDWSQYEKTSGLSFIYTSVVTGNYDVRALLSDNGKEYFSNTVTFRVEAVSGSVFGASPTGEISSANADISEDKGDSPKVTHKAVSRITNEYAFAKNINSSKFVLSAVIDIVAPNYGDPFPKTGLFIKSGGVFHIIVFDARPGCTHDDVIFTSGNDENWNWPGTVFKTTASFRSGGARISNRLTLIRNGTDFYFLVNGEYLGFTKVEGLTGNAAAGTFTMAQHAVFTEYFAHSDTTAADDAFDLALADAIGKLSAFDGEVIGHTGDGTLKTTNGFDLSRESDASPVTVQEGKGDQYTYFKEVYHNKYMIKAEAGMFSPLSGDNHPKFGLLAARTADSAQIACFSFDIDTGAGFAGQNSVYTLGFHKNNAGDWVWQGLEDALWRNNPSNGFNEYMVIRDGAAFYYFIGGILIGQLNNLPGIGANTPAYAGLMTMQCNVTFKNYECETDAAAVDALLSSLLNRSDGGWTAYNSGVAEIISPSSLSFTQQLRGDLSGFRTDAELAGFEMSFTITGMAARAYWADGGLVNPGFDIIFKGSGIEDRISICPAAYQKFFAGAMAGGNIIDDVPLSGSTEALDMALEHNIRIVRAVTDGEALYTLYFDGAAIVTQAAGEGSDMINITAIEIYSWWTAVTVTDITFNTL